MKKLSVLLTLLVLVCLCLTGCIADYKVVGANGKTFEVPGSVPVKGTLVLEIEKYLENGMRYPDDIIPPTMNELMDARLTYTARHTTKAVFNPIEGGEKLVVPAKYITAHDRKAEDTKVLEIKVPYELKPGKYALTILSMQDVEPSEFEFDVIADGKVIGTTLVQRFEGDENYIKMTVVDAIPTGDAAHLVMWAVLAAAGCAGLVVLMLKKRRA